MEVQVEKTGPYLRKLSVTIPGGEVREAFDTAYRKLGKRVSVPGFRPGKVPRGVLEARYGQEALSEVRTELVEKTLTQAMKENEIAAVAVPNVDLGDLVSGVDFSYTAEIEVKPEVELVKWQGLEAPQVEVAVEEDEVERQLEAMRQRATQLVPVMIRDVVQEGDVVLTDYEGTVGGTPFAGGKAEGTLVEIGGEGMLPGFSTGLIGAKVPGERVVAVDFPEDYGVEDLAGKSASFSVHLKELKSKQVPELDDEFAKDVGQESLDALRQTLREGILAQKEKEARDVRRRGVLESLVQHNPVEVPPSMLAAETDRLVASAAQRVQRMVGQQFQLSPDDLQTLRADGEKDARFRVVSGLLLLAVAEKEGVKVEEDEVQAEIDKIVAALGDSAARLRSHFNDPDMLQEVRYRLVEDKVVDLLLESSVTAPQQPEAEQPEAEQPEAEQPASQDTPASASSTDLPSEVTDGTQP